MNYDEAREQFLEAAKRDQSRVQRLRARLASNALLRRAFDATYGSAYRSVFSARPIRHRVAPYLDRYDVAFSPSGSGFSQAAEVARLARMNAIRGKDILLIGVEYGGEIEQLWGRHKPRSIVGIDIGDYEKGWARCTDQPTPVVFARMDAAALGFADARFDLVYSQGVLPHIVDVPSFLADAHRVLRPGGIFYAFCCPLWHTYGGSHVHALGYDHLRLPAGELLERARAVGDGSFWWLDGGLFNKLRFRDLVAMLEGQFQMLRIGVIEAPDARRLRDRAPEEWRELRVHHDEEDLLIRLVSFTARRR